MGSDYNRLDHESPSLALGLALRVQSGKRRAFESPRTATGFLENKNELYPERDRIEGSC